jgi:transcriptional regulator with XRE-family HTH domain
MNTAIRSGFGEVLRRERVRIPLTLQELSAMSGVSPSHLGRIERGERFPSAGVLKNIDKPLGLEEDEIFTLAGYLSPQSSTVSEMQPEYGSNRLDPYVSRVLAQEPIEIQRAVVGLLSIIKSISKSAAS